MSHTPAFESEHLDAPAQSQQSLSECGGHKSAYLRYPYLSLLLLALLLFLPGLTTIPIFDRDSAHFAQATRQMVETGNYFQIRFQDITRFQKPPGINWLQAISVNLFSNAASNSVWPYRLPSMLGGLLSILLCFALARRRLSDQTAWIAAALLGSTLLLGIESHLIVIDAMLLVSVLLMQGALWHCYDTYRRGESVHWLWTSAFWLAMSWGICLKGVTPLVGLLTVAMLMLMDRDWRVLTMLRPGWGVLILLLSSTWLLGVNAAENSNYLWQIIQKDLLPKLQGGHESHGKPFGFHFFLLPLTFWPASLFLWRGLVWAWRYRTGLVERFLLSWIVPTFLFFELMPTKLPQYVLPTFPALAMLCALAITHSQQLTISNKHRWWLNGLYAIWLVLSLAIAAASLWLPLYFLKYQMITSIVIAIGLSSGVLYALWQCWQARFQRAVSGVLAAALITYGGIYHGLLPSLLPLWTTESIAAAVKPFRITNDQPLLSIGYGEPSLVFVLGTQHIRYSNPADLAHWVQQHRNTIVLIDDRFLDAVQQQLSRKLVRQQALRSFNYSKGEWIALGIYQIH